MEKKHTILNCWCSQQEDEEEKSAMAEMAKDNKRESFLDGYKDISGENIINRKELLKAPF